MTYKGEKQGDGMCVFASVSAALNFAAGKAVWTQYTLLEKWHEKKGTEQVTFDKLLPIAIQPIQDHVKAHQHCDETTAISNEDYLKTIKECVDTGGIAIVSLELADHVDSQLKRKGLWHMLSLTSRDGDVFTAWDTAGGNQRMVSADQLVSHFPYGDGVLAVHNEHDVLFVQPV